VNRIELRPPYGPDALAIDGERVVPGPSLELRNHSPTGFSWGYGGSGPAQTALAILLHVSGDTEASLRHYMDFKHEHVARWPQESTTVELDVAAWLRRKEHVSFEDLLDSSLRRHTGKGLDDFDELVGP
jgi:hypothetical protein